MLTHLKQGTLAHSLVTLTVSSVMLLSLICHGWCLTEVAPHSQATNSSSSIAVCCLSVHGVGHALMPGCDHSHRMHHPGLLSGSGRAPQILPPSAQFLMLTLLLIALPGGRRLLLPSHVLLCDGPPARLRCMRFLE